MRRNNLQMVIPCGGLATRLGDLAKKTPKGLMDIHGKPFLEWQLEILKKHGFDEVVLLIGHLGEQIKEYFGDGSAFGIKISYSKDDDLGVIGAVKNAEAVLRDEFFLMYGDSYLPSFPFHDMDEAFQTQEKLALMSVWNNKSQIDPSNVTVQNGEVVQVGDPNAEHIDYGVIALRKEALQHVPEGKKFSTGEFWNILSGHRQLASYEVTKRYYDIGSPERLEEVRNLIGETTCLKP